MIRRATLAALLAVPVTGSVEVTALAQQEAEIAFRSTPRTLLRYETLVTRRGTLTGVARTAAGVEQRLDQTSEYVLDFYDEILPTREGRRRSFAREFARADVLTTMRYAAPRPPELEQRTLPFDGELLRFRERADGHYEVVRDSARDLATARDRTPAPLRALGTPAALRDPHLPDRPVRAGETWNVPAAQVAASLVYGPLDDGQTVDGLLTVRFVRIDPAFPVKHVFEAVEIGEQPQTEIRHTRCAVLAVHGTWTARSRAGTTLVSTVERTLHYAIEEGVVVHAKGDGTWRLTGRKRDTYTLDYRGAFEESAVVDILVR